MLAKKSCSDGITFHDYFYYQIKIKNFTARSPNLLDCNYYLQKTFSEQNYCSGDAKQAKGFSDNRIYYGVTTAYFGKLEFNYFWYFVVNDSYFMLKNTYQHVDYKETLEFLINLLTNKYNNWQTSKLLAEYSVAQIQLIKNKKMQNSWIKRNSKQLFFIYKFGNINLNKKQQFLTIRGLSLDLKGRAADLRWVRLRYLKFGKLTYSWKDFLGSSNWKSSQIFLTKWGSINIKSSSSSYKFQRLNSKLMF